MERGRVDRYRDHAPVAYVRGERRAFHSTC